jgi:hypothetical protein
MIQLKQIGAFNFCFFGPVRASISVLHKEWCNLFFLNYALENRPVFRATIEPV